MRHISSIYLKVKALIYHIEIRNVYPTAFSDYSTRQWNEESMSDQRNCEWLRRELRRYERIKLNYQCTAKGMITFNEIPFSFIENCEAYSNYFETN